jgi:predicted Abi (CAAX) family protease
MKSQGHTVAFSARLPKELNEEFNAVQQAYGSRVWFVRTALQRFNATIKEHPEMIPQIKAEIDIMLSTGFDSPEGTVAFVAQIPRDDYNEFNQVFPQYGATSWFLRSITRAFIREAIDYPTGQALVYRAIDSILVPPSVGASE